MEPFTLFFLLVLIFSIIVHEVSHGLAAEMLGDPTARLQGRLTLNPLPHIDIFGSIIVPAILVLSHSTLLFGWAKPVPYNPYNLRNKRWGEAIVAVAGPASNILLAVVFGLLIRFGSGSLPTQFISYAGIIVFVNIILAFFNLIPFPPLDGSKILKSVLPFKASLAFQNFENKLMSGGILMMILILWFLISFIGPYLSMLFSILFTLTTGSNVCAVIPWICM